MKRFHVHVAVSDLAHSTRFYSAMFGAAPSVEKPDYAKWMLDDPRINFAISTRAGKVGANPINPINHLGFQADSDAELQEIHARLQAADTTVTAELGASCCYAKSDKYWVQDPSGIAWESFRSLDTIPFYGEENQRGVVAGSMETTASTPTSIDAAGGTACCPAPVAVKTNERACCNG